MEQYEPWTLRLLVTHIRSEQKLWSPAVYADSCNTAQRQELMGLLGLGAVLLLHFSRCS
jgi:hypothetical protein